MKNGIQLYSLREMAAAEGAEAVFAAVAEAGYDGVEFAGFYGMTPDETADMLDRYGLEGVSAHIACGDVEASLPHIERLGIRNVFIPWMQPGRLDHDRDGMIAEIVAAKALLDGRGVTFGFHNHAAEYANGQDCVWELMEAVPGLTSELDVYWAKAAGREPTALMKKYGSRLAALHIKELADGADPTTRPNPVVGEGVVGMEEVYALGKEMGIAWGILEVEAFPGDVRDYLKKSCQAMQRLAR